MKPKALYYSCLSYQAANQKLLKQFFDVFELFSPDEDRPSILKEVEVLFAPLGFPVDIKKISLCPRLKAVVSNTTGIPHLDARALNARGVAICALHDEKEFLDQITPTAEHTIGLMMALWRKIPAAHEFVLKGNWDRRPWGAPKMLSRMRLGVVGYGRLGKKVANIAAAIGMKVNYFDPHVWGGAENLLELAEKTDVLSIHAVANEETKNLIDRIVLGALPKGAIVVNTARGEILDSDALLDLLESGHLLGAALDTIDGEYETKFTEKLKSSRLLAYARKNQNLILTPHIGGSTIDAWSETERYTILKAAKALGLKDQK